MEISIITVCYNNADGLKKTIESVLEQTVRHEIEYIVIDGNSNDNTSQIIKQFEDSIDILVSEPDSGAYNAMNKGLKKANNPIIGFLHAGDVYYNQDILEKIIRKFKTEEVDALYGDLVYVQKNNPDKIFRYWKSQPFEKKLMKMGWMPPHPTFYVKKLFYERFGGFDENFKIASDYDLMLRFLYREQISVKYIPEVLVKMQTGGLSNRSLNNILKKSFEDIKALKKNRLHIWAIVWKNLSKLKQFAVRSRQSAVGSLQ